MTLPLLAGLWRSAAQPVRHQAWTALYVPAETAAERIGGLLPGLPLVAGQGTNGAAGGRHTAGMADGLHGPNVVRAGESSLLLVRVSGGQAVHLACQHEPPKPGRGAVPDYFFDPSNRERDTIQRRYDIAALRDPVWAHTTMCGRVWAAMVGGDGGPLSRYREPAFAPTCRRCLTLMDRLFPAPAVDQRVPVVAQLVFEAVHARIRRGAGRAR